MTPNDDCSGRTAPLTSKRCILYIYSTNTDTEYFKHSIYCPFFFSSKCSLFHISNVICSCFIHILYTGCAKIKKNNSDAKRLSIEMSRKCSCGPGLRCLYRDKQFMIRDWSDASPDESFTTLKCAICVYNK